MDSNILFTTVRVGRHVLENRVVMAPMTRSRASDDGVPGAHVPEYYAQRASAGLIISEGIYPSAMGKGYVRTPGLHTGAQVEAWQQVTAAVHARGGLIFAQIMHAGRISDPSLLPGRAAPVAPSAIRPEGVSYTDAGLKPHVTPRALERVEIGQIIREYADATHRALAAGFDGVELHAASGYLPMQFLSTGSNHRTDEYGGTAENRSRFVVEALDAMTAVAGADRVGIKISPEMAFNDIRDDDPQQTYLTLLRLIGDKGLAYLHVTPYSEAVDYHALLKPLFRGTYLAGAGLDRESATQLLLAGRADAAVFGTPFVANPDLPERFRRGAALNVPDTSTFYTPGAKGYIDYPTLESLAA